ncbi:MAG: hypothetical protein M5U25_20730 [Planctomycetota bacterium]|nr:hypothetical protein [Planctomycetota bacterium]
MVNKAQEVHHVARHAVDAGENHHVGEPRVDVRHHLPESRTVHVLAGRALLAIHARQFPALAQGVLLLEHAAQQVFLGVKAAVLAHGLLVS